MSDLQTPDSKARSDKTSKRLRWALVASLAVNFAVAGMVIGARFHNDGPRGGFARELNFGAFTEALSHEDRDKLRAAVMAKAPDMRAARRQMREDMAAVLTALRATPFDANALEAALSVQNRRMASQLELGQGLLREFLLSMSAEARSAFADRLEDRLRRGGDKP
jgi:uncharacterized membrane protein